jgi:signal transduction histidine kinase
MSLRSRLILSYIIIILATLTLAFLTLVLVARPLQNRLATARLAVQSRQAARQINNMYQRGASTEQVIERLNSRIANDETRFALIDRQGIALTDSQEEWTGQQLALKIQAEPLSNFSGSFTDPGGESFSYAAAPIGPAGEPAGYILVAVARAPVLPRLITELSWGFSLASLIALLASLLLGVLIARSIARPLQRIAAAAAAVAAGDYAHRIPESGPREIKRVAASFNLMARQVEASQKAMRDFVSNVSHELKTPLTSIQGFSQAIMEGATQDEAGRRRAASIIHQEAARMSRLVEDLLDLARIDSGQVVMHKTPLDLAQILHNTVERLLPQAAEKEIRLARNWQELPPQVVGDGDRLAQVFTNLLDNAIRHTPKGGRVVITGKTARALPLVRSIRPGQVQPDTSTMTTQRGDFAEVSIADTGPGIPPDDLARIFERFYQVDKSRKRGRGTGLGLAIIKEIIEAHRGQVRAESVEGVGTRFTILLPLSEADVETVVSPRQ